jgi:tetratricopeptide (TPR) repeat protein
MAKTDKSNLLKTGMTQVAQVVNAAKRRISPRNWLFISLGILLVGAVALAVAFRKDLKGNPVAAVTTVANKIEAAVAPTLDDLKAAVAKDPKDAKAQLALGDALFAAGKQQPGLAAYDAALGLDPKLANDKLAENLVGCFGTPNQAAAYNVILHRNVIGAEPALHKLANDKRHTVRTNAVAALDKLGKVTRDDWMSMWILDTNEENCDLRRNAVEKLGQFGDRRALTAIRSANKKDDDQTHWYQLTCLRSRPEDAEKKILARR